MQIDVFPTIKVWNSYLLLLGLLIQRMPNVCSIHHLVLVQSLAYAVNHILIVLVVLMGLVDTMDDIQFYHVHRSNADDIQLNLMVSLTNYQSIVLYIHMYRCRCNAYVLEEHENENKVVSGKIFLDLGTSGTVLPGQHFGTIARKVAGSGAHSKHCGSIISKPNVDGHSIFSQCTPFAVQIHNDSQPS